MTVARMMDLVSPFNERYVKLQTDAAKIVLAEMMIRQREFQNLASSVTALWSWPYVQQANSTRMENITHQWLDLLSAAPLAMARVFGAPLFATAESVGAEPASAPHPERRVSAVVINFPDRRRAAGR